MSECWVLFSNKSLRWKSCAVNHSLGNNHPLPDSNFKAFRVDCRGKSSKRVLFFIYFSWDSTGTLSVLSIWRSSSRVLIRCRRGRPLCWSSECLCTRGWSGGKFSISTRLVFLLERKFITSGIFSIKISFLRRARLLCQPTFNTPLLLSPYLTHHGTSNWFTLGSYRLCFGRARNQNSNLVISLGCKCCANFSPLLISNSGARRSLKLHQNNLFSSVQGVRT